MTETYFTEQEDDIHSIVERYQLLDQDNSPRAQQQKSLIFDKLAWIPRRHYQRYLGFSNAQDLAQEGQIALLYAIRSWKKKGPFVWWADQYLRLRVPRAANCYSIVKFPMAKASQIKPKRFELSMIPEGISSDDTEMLEKRQQLERALEKLEPSERSVTEYGIGGYNLTETADKLGIEKAQARKLLNSSKNKLRQDLAA